MRDQQDRTPQVPLQEMRDQLRIATVLMQAFSMPLGIWTRHFGTWGQRYASQYMAMGWIAMPAFTMFFPKEDPRPICLFWIVTTSLLIVHRIAGVLRRRRGYWVHSQYSGVSRIPGDEWRAKSWHEPWLAMVIGGGVCLANAPLGAWLITAGICQGITVSIQWDAEKARIRAARDARFMAQYEMDILRRELGEN